MTQLIPLSSDHVIGFRIDGKITEEDFDRVTSAIEEKLEDRDKIQLYVEITSLDGIPLKLWLKDFAFGVKHFRRFDRMVVVTDKNWIDKAVKVEGALIPGLETRVFSSEDKVRAMDWLLAGEPA